MAALPTDGPLTGALHAACTVEDLSALAMLAGSPVPLAVLDQTIARWTAGVTGTAGGPRAEEASAWT